MIYWVGFLSVLISIESVFAGTCFFLLFPTPQLAPNNDVLANYERGITPKHDVFFLRLFMVVGVASFILLMRYCKKMSAQKWDFFKYFTVVQAAVIITETFFLFKYALYHYPVWLNGFYASLIVSFAIKIFTPEVLKFVRFINERMKDKKPLSNYSFWLTVGGVVLIPLIIWVPDVEGAVARIFFGEQFHHIDGMLMAPAWAHLSGNILGVDTTSRYGLGFPILVGEISKHLFGRFDYVTALLVMMIMSVLYYWTWFYALRLLFKDAAWAFIAIFLGLRFQFFNIETFPFIFTYPQNTPSRFFFDSLFFLFLILHTETGRMRWLYLSSAIAGFFVFYMTGEGAYTLATFYLVLVLREAFIIKNPGSPMPRLNKKQAAVLAALPWVVLLSSMWLVAGANIFTKIFWDNQVEYIRYYEIGLQTSLMMNNITPPYVDRASIAFIMPVFYLFGLVVILGRLMQKSLKADGLIMACAFVFLLISYHYNTSVSNNMPSYLRFGVVVAMVPVFFLKEITAGLGAYHQRLCKFFTGIAVLLMIVTTHQFLLHPNIFNLSHNPITHPVVSEVPDGRNSYFNHLWISYPDAYKLPVNGLGEKNEMLVTENDFADDNQLKEFYRKESDYTKDAALIQSLTTPDQQIPLISAFENLILMQAKRRPFFYYYTLDDSQPRRMRRFSFTFLHTKSSLQREFDKIDSQKPPYVFIEKTFFVSPIPQAYLYDSGDLIAMLRYVFTYYQPYKAGEFLVAMKRK